MLFGLALPIRPGVFFTRVDAIANMAVILSGIAVIVTGIRFFDLAIGGAIGVYVITEAVGILREAREAKS
ncbi:MAG: hypothetical protein H0W71_06530 [Sphingomonas sp.]|nr:hypothetical protein [Sphingomonas sp.]